MSAPRPHAMSGPEPEFLLFRDVRVAAEDRPVPEAADVLVSTSGGIVERVGGPGEIEPREGWRVLEGGGSRVLLPGLFDVHVHVRDPGHEDAETFRSASEAALNGGITGMVVMPDTTPALDSGGIIQSVLDHARDHARVLVRVSGCLTVGRAGSELAAIASMKEKGVAFLTDNGRAVRDPLVLRRAMEYARNFDLTVATHCEIPELSADGAMNEGRRSFALGIPGMPAIGEEICIERDIRLARYTGTRLHLQQVSTARGIESVRRAKEDGVPVTCEVSPHHLIFNEEHLVDYDTNLKTNPPLRTPEDNEGLLAGLVDGVVDVIASDHSPQSEFEKNRDFAGAPFGITGLETALPALHHHFVARGRFGWDLVVRRFSSEPRRLAGLEPVAVAPGGAADLVLFDPGAMTAVTKAFLRSRSANTPFLGRELEGAVVAVVRAGRLVLDRGNESLT